MSASQSISTQSRDALSLYDRLNGLLETAGEFDAPIQVYTNAAKKIMGNNPQKTYAEASEEKRETLTKHMETLSKMALAVLG